MVRSSQKTLFATDLHLHQLAGKDYTPLPNTTLNEKFNVNSMMTVPPGEYPTLKYFVIGVGGSSNIENDNMYTISEHGPLDGALFEHVPFVIRPVNSDLTAGERSKYRLRVLKIIGGTTYACYYAKLLGNLEIPQYLNKITTVTPEDTSKLQYSTISVLDTDMPEILNPTPRTRILDVEKLSSIERVTRLAKVTMEFSEYDLNEIKNSIQVLGLNATTVKEIGLCSGYDIKTTLMTEAIAMQILYHVGMTMQLSIFFNNKDTIIRTIELGGEEPLVK